MDEKIRLENAMRFTVRQNESHLFPNLRAQTIPIDAHSAFVLVARILGFCRVRQLGALGLPAYPLGAGLV